MATTQHTTSPTFDLARLAQIHRDTVGPTAPDAGRLRHVNMSTKDGEQRLAYTRIQDIERYAQAIATEIKANNNFRDLPQDQWAQKVGQTVTDLNTLRPFREGNDATTKAFAQELAKERGLTLAFDRVTPQQWDRATKDSIAGNPSTVSQLLADIARPDREHERTASPRSVERAPPDPALNSTKSFARETPSVASVPFASSSPRTIDKAPDKTQDDKTLAQLTDIAAKHGLVIRQPHQLSAPMNGTVIDQTDRHLLVKVGVSIAVPYEKERLNQDARIGQTVSIEPGRDLSLVAREPTAPQRPTPTDGSPRTQRDHQHDLTR